MYIKTVVEVSYDVPDEYQDAMMFAKNTSRLDTCYG